MNKKDYSKSRVVWKEYKYRRFKTGFILTDIPYVYYELTLLAGMGK
ncbi:hypothetical protein JOC76_002779 [Neobacillus cucumis]|nr:hypothetical protein [Neobacillus cucumis]